MHYDIAQRPAKARATRNDFNDRPSAIRPLHAIARASRFALFLAFGVPIHSSHV
jgi:hypothetical protein